MSVVGLITEYNPFHNGHKYHIERAKELTGADSAVVVMSGNFVQRGAPAFIDKYSRAKMALNNGADLIIELPYIYANSSAEYFATGAINTLYQLGVDKLCFGCETDNSELLMSMAKLLANEPAQLSSCIKKYSSMGLSYPSARAKALAEYTNNELRCSDSSLYNDIDFNFINKPNNILAIEYLKCIIKNKLPIKPYPLKRKGNEFHSIELGDFASASAIRHFFNADNSDSINLTNINSNFINEDILLSVPADVAKFFKEYYLVTFPVTSEHFKDLIYYKLLSLQSAGIDIAKYYDVTNDLANRIYNHLGFSISSLDSYIKSLNAKNYTYTRIERALFHILLDYTKDDFESFSGSTPYINVLGFNKNGQKILKDIKKNSDVLLITKKSDAKKNLSSDAYKIFEYDLKAMRLYNQIVYSTSNNPELAAKVISDDYRRGVIII